METALDQFWFLIWGTLTLNREVFNTINTLSAGNTIALIIVMAAGLSQAIGQCVVLFINRVKPLRFFLSLAIAALLFAFAYFFWAMSVGLVSHFLFGTEITLRQLITVLRTLGLSYAPLLFSFFIGLPYFGIPVFILLSLWSLLAEIVGWQTLTNLGTWEAFVCAGLGWLVFQILQRTVGRPIVLLGRWIQNKVAGTKLVRDSDGLEEIVLAGNPITLSDVSNEVLIEASTSVTRRRSPRKFSWFKFILLGLIALAIVILLSTDYQTAIAIWYRTLNITVQLIINLIGISFIALFISILLTPLEALGWWAGWYGSEPLQYLGTPVETISPSTKIDRYVMYLDGINQGSYEYLPRVENLLNELAATLPENILIVKGILPYSVTNRPASENAIFGFLWRIIESLLLKNPANPIGLIVNIRNIVAVAISADPRYGPIQNQGLAQVLFNSLVSFGYPVGSQIPVTLIGYSGGGQMSMGAVSFLKQTLNAPLEVISLAGVISGNTGAMQVEQLYHLVGYQDHIEKLGPIMFPGRWPLWFLSNWNCAKRRGKIALISLGPVGHNGPGGPMAVEGILADGRTHLQQTVDILTEILLKDREKTDLYPQEFQRISNYERYQTALFNQPSYYPVNQSINREYYQPVGSWIGRLILPPAAERQKVKGVWLEIYHADRLHQHRIGQIVNLRWNNETRVQTYVKLVTQDVNFIDQAYLSQRQGNIHPERINGWQKVDPLESLAGALPDDRMIVKLPDPVIVEDTGAERPSLYINRDPIQIIGRFYGLVKILQFRGGDLFTVRHYNRQSQQFNGLEEIVYIPTAIANRNGVFPSSNYELEKSPLNSSGWYIYGAKNTQGMFVVEAIAPRSLFSLKPDRVITGKKSTLNFMNFHAWDNTVENKGHAYTTLLAPHIDNINKKSAHWQEGDRALLMHVFGGIGGKNPEFSPLGIYFGHFAFGMAKVIREPLSNELRFQIEYRQIYTHNSSGITSGTLDWTRYMGARQWGWLGCRPICDVLVQFSPLTEDYDFDGLTFSPLNYVMNELEIMAARYRVGDGTGTTFVSAINSCVQDSSQAFYYALKRMMGEIELNPLIIKWLKDNPHHEQTQRFILLVDLVENLKRYITPLKKVRPDWRYNLSTLGSFPIETPGQTLLKIIASWRTLLPRWTCDQVAMIFLQLGASLWLLRSNQVGGNDPSIQPIAPTDFSIFVPPIKKSKKIHREIG
ncbi:MAG: peptidase [Lyngbya sp.]|nr:peptidase [Lyngbya sp.]